MQKSVDCTPPSPTFTSKTTKQDHASFFSKLVKQTNHSMLIFV